MSSISVHPSWPGARVRDRRATELFIRFLLAALAVGICYCFEWTFLRGLTMTLNARVDALAGVVLQPLSSTQVMWNGGVYRYVIACTFADVWCAALPLVWDFRVGLPANLKFVAIFTVGLFAFNVFRLSLSDVVVAHRVPWDWGHNVVGGVAYFAVWEVVWRRMRAVVPSERKKADIAVRL